MSAWVPPRHWNAHARQSIWRARVAADKEARAIAERTRQIRERGYAVAMLYARTVLLFVVTAIAEILGCYLPYLWLRQQRSPLLLVPAALSLALFAWLLTLHPTGASRTYAAYGGVYVVTAIAWLWLVEGQVPARWDLIGGAVALLGMAIIAFAPR